MSADTSEKELEPSSKKVWWRSSRFVFGKQQITTGIYARIKSY
jgi:hypothetical protein